MNIQNIKNLLKTYFIENWKTDLFQFGMLMVIVLFGTIMSSRGNLNFPIFVASIFLMIYPERLFRNLHGNSSKIHYLSIPASNSEKVLANLVLANVYYVVGLIVSCCLGLGLAQLYITLRGFESLHFYTALNGVGVMLLCVLLAMFFFGSIYFRRKTTLATLGVSLLIGTIIITLYALTLWINGIILIPKDAVYNDYMWSYSSYVIPDAVQMIVLGLVTVFFYALSFLRMKETEA
ncbi:MAG: hypothetical protein IKZ52_08010 [Bacteroidales bacterium]|nr:hypothetical protein [Bacteroidales bacterium]